jgi:hypothetical protein
VDNTANLVAEIDGKPIKNLERFRIRSPLFTIGPVPEPNILNAPKGTITQSVDAGVLLVLPMKPGRHTIHSGMFTVWADDRYHPSDHRHPIDPCNDRMEDCQRQPAVLLSFAVR